MIEMYELLEQDYKSGVFKWSDVSITYLQKIGGGIIDRVMQSAEAHYKDIKKIIAKELSNDLVEITREVNQTQNLLGEVFRSIMGGGK